MSITFGTGVIVINKRWTAFKAVMAAKYLIVQFDEEGDLYVIFGSDGNVVYRCDIWKQNFPESPDYTQEQNDADLADFEANVKPVANQPIEPRTKDGRMVVRNSTANRTTNFKLRAITVYTSELVEGFHNVSPVTDTDYGDVSIKLYKADGTEITQEADEVYAVKTVLDFDPHYNYEIIGGFLDIPSDLRDGTTNEWFIAAIGVPDYPPQYFGQIDFISEVNLEAVTAARITSDGRAVSYMPYNYGGNPYTNRLRFILKHPAGAKKRFQLYIEHFV